jgi:anti-anti-sigma regulatory factor
MIASFYCQSDDLKPLRQKLGNQFFQNLKTETRFLSYFFLLVIFSMGGGTMEFEYQIVEKGPVVVLTLKGRLTKEVKEKVEECIKEVSIYESKTFILYFKSVIGIDQIALRDFSLLQQEIRRKNEHLFLVGLTSSLKQDLYDRGVIRLNEVRNSLEDALNQ